MWLRISMKAALGRTIRPENRRKIPTCFQARSPCIGNAKIEPDVV